MKLRAEAISTYLAALESGDVPSGNGISTAIKLGEKFSTPYENYNPNSLWGHGAIIRSEYEIGDGPLNVVLAHGPQIHQLVWTLEYRVGFPVLVYSYYHALQMIIGAQNLGERQPELVLHSSPYELVQRKRENNVFNKIISQEQRNGCIYFPIHSTARLQWLSYEHSPQQLREFEYLRKAYGTLNLCIYFVDFQRLIEQDKFFEYVAPFDNIYCCGHRNDPAFLPRLNTLLNKHIAVYSDEWSSVLFYGAVTGNELLVKNYSGFKFAVEAYKGDDKKFSKLSDDVANYFSRATTSSIEEHTNIRLVTKQKFIASFLSGNEDRNEVKKILKRQQEKGELFLKNPFQLHEQNFAGTEKYFLSE